MVLRTRTGMVNTVALGLLASAGWLASPALTPTAAAATPTHALSVSGTGVGMYPAFAASIDRFAVTTTDQTSGSITVDASTTDTSGIVRINGRIATGPTTLTGLSAGDEISVIYQDSDGTETHSLYVAPAGFPALVATGSRTGLAAGDVFVTLTQWNGGSAFEAALDSNGVPTYARKGPTSDFKRSDQDADRYLAIRPPASEGRTGGKLVELDEKFEPTGRTFEVSGHENTDSHDAQINQDGTVLLTGYEPNADHTLVDAVIQLQAPDGTVLFDWNSGAYVDPAVESVSDYTKVTQFGSGDYAHLNSVQLVNGGNDVLASFRHFSSVYLIAVKPHDGFASGDIVWRLGGKHSSFDFPAGDGGPCAQHSAYMLGNGHVLLYDNGSSPFGGNMCIDPEDPTGDPIARPQTRVTEYALDTTAHTATPVWNWQEPGRFAFFAGNAQRLANGNTMVGWASDNPNHMIATEVNSAGDKIWELADQNNAASPFYATYRAQKFLAPDQIDPVIDGSQLFADGATFDRTESVALDFGCTDRGGSNLVSCGGAKQPGDWLDTNTPGQHQLTLVATDGAGNQDTVSRSYTVTSVEAPPTPTISGTAKYWSLLTVDPGVWPPADTLSYRWLRDGTPIKGATGSTYRPHAADIGHKLSVAVTGSRTGYAPFTKTSAATAVVVPEQFRTSPRPTMTGTRKVGRKLTASTGRWSPAATFSYQWQRDGRPIARATGRSYALRAADRRHRIRVVVTATRSGYADTVRRAIAVRIF